MSLRQLTSLLARPTATTRPWLRLVAVSPKQRSILSSSSVVGFSTTHSRNALRHTKPAAFSIPEYSTSPPAGLTPAQLFEHSTLPFFPRESLEDGLTTLFTRNPATFYYGNPDFYHLRKNTRIPEVCIIGRSNVGKSSLVNAVANRTGSELARVSKKAGHTKTINAYGFGPPPRPEKGEVVVSDEFKGKEEMPKHMFFLVDMPGYGHGSLQEWGKNISLYLQKRTALKGAIMLIDAEVGPKVHDWDAIELMANAGLRMAIVLTKADKAGAGNEGLLQTCQAVWEGIRRIESQLAENNKKWTWDKEFYVTASGAVNGDVRRATVTTARLAIARLAGLVKDKRPEATQEQKWSGKLVSFDELFGSSSAEQAETLSSHRDQHEESPVIAEEWEAFEESVEEDVDQEEVVTFESQRGGIRHQEIKSDRRAKPDERSRGQTRDYSQNNTKNGKLSASPRGKPRSNTTGRTIVSKQRSTRSQSSQPLPRKPASPFDKLEAASRPTLGSRSNAKRTLPRASFFHTTTRAYMSEAPSDKQSHPLNQEELSAVLADFIKTLQPSPTLRDIVRQRQFDLENGIDQPSPEALKQSWADRIAKNKEQLAKEYKKQTRHIRHIRERRLAIEEEKLQRQEEMLAEQARLAKDTDWVAIRREMRILEKEQKAQEAALAAAALEESRRVARENGTLPPEEHGDLDGEELEVAYDLDGTDGDDQDNSLYRKSHRHLLDEEDPRALHLQIAKKSKGKKGRKELDEFEKVFASKIASTGGGGKSSKRDKGNQGSASF